MKEKAYTYYHNQQNQREGGQAPLRAPERLEYMNTTNGVTITRSTMTLNNGKNFISGTERCDN